jgi:hypothetical protein
MEKSQGWTEWFPVVSDGASLASYTYSPPGVVVSHARVLTGCKSSEMRCAVKRALRPFVKISVTRK